MLNLALVQIREALAQVPYIARINNQDDYVRALELMDELVDDYDTNKQLIELLATSIERWEDGAYEFANFNKAVASVEPGIAALMNRRQFPRHLKTLNGLTISYQILSAAAASITELKRNPMGTLKKCHGSAVAIRNRNEPVFYCVPPELFAYYVELADDAELNRIADERIASLDRVNVLLDEL